MKSLEPGLLENITQRLVTEFQPEQIFLFGSHAWGTPDEDSDIDLLVVLPDDAKPEHYQLFDLYVVQKWPVRKITATLGVNAGQVYLAKHRISSLLKKEIARLEKE